MRDFFLMLLSLGAQITLFAFYIRVDEDGQLTAAYIFFHAVLSLGFGWSLLRFIPQAKNSKRWLSLLSVGVLPFFIPILGSFGMLLLVLALRYPKIEEVYPWRAIPIPDLPHRPLFIDTDSPLKYSEGALAEVLRYSGDADKRVAAVMALRNMKDEQAIPLLRIALKDPVDDVRLLAYSMLDSKDKTINLSIQDRLSELESAHPEESFYLHKQVATSYWELVYLGIASGDVLVFSLEQAAKHIHEALKISDDAGSYLLLGRIALRKRDYCAAQEAFGKAQALGLTVATVAPHQAELAFYQRDFEGVHGTLSSIDREFLACAPMDAIAQYWLGAQK